MADKNNAQIFNTGSDGASGSQFAPSKSQMKTTQKTAYKFNTANSTTNTSEWDSANWNEDWGSKASRSIYNTFVPLNEKDVGNTSASRSLLNSRLWKGVPQLTDEMMGAFDAAFNGHYFVFVKNVPRFMCTGIYAGTSMHNLVKNFKAIVERAITGFSGSAPITLEAGDAGNSEYQSLQVPVRVQKRTNNINLELHEFAGLPVKNCIETWITGIYDPYSQHGNYHGNLGIPGGWCLQNHTMSMLAVQVDPTWTEIMDAAYYTNMIPTEVPNVFSYRKGSTEVIENANLNFVCTEYRSAAVMKAAELYMNNRILKFAQTAAFNNREFVPASDFAEKSADLGSENIFGDYNYDIKLSGTKSMDAILPMESTVDATIKHVN